ncbi:hypothetical protein DFH09DRAFT_435710 [Mycena vulgaris]|nr:hypothetical protein DFH09DRAFT_435710 [Mycena vulgaris]
MPRAWNRPLRQGSVGRAGTRTRTRIPYSRRLFGQYFLDLLATAGEDLSEQHTTRYEGFPGRHSPSDLLVVVSPFEANKWLPEIRRSEFVSLHLYTPRLSRNAFWSFENLESFTVAGRRSRVPRPQLIHELNLFAG